MDQNLEPVYEFLNQAQKPEDIFGQPPVYSQENQREKVQVKYDELLQVVNPDLYQHPLDTESARDALGLLDTFREEALKKIEARSYGISVTSVNVGGMKTFLVGARTFYLGEKYHVGPIYTFYHGYFDMRGFLGRVGIKIVNDVKDNHRIDQERRVLDIIHTKDVPQKRHVAIVFSHFETNERMPRKGIIFRRIGGYDFNQVMRQHRAGVDQTRVDWILDRYLSLFTILHRSDTDIVHGRLCPSRMMVRTKSHNAFLFSWGEAMIGPEQQYRYASDDFDAQFLAPESVNGGLIGPWTDIYSLGKIMIWLLGGNVQTNEMPTKVNAKFQKFLLKMVESDYERRVYDAYELYQEKNVLVESLWGREPKPLHMS